LNSANKPGLSKNGIQKKTKTKTKHFQSKTPILYDADNNTFI